MRNHGDRSPLRKDKDWFWSRKVNAGISPNVVESMEDGRRKVGGALHQWSGSGMHILRAVPSGQDPIGNPHPTRLVKLLIYYHVPIGEGCT